MNTYVAIDVGGTMMKFGLLNEEGIILQKDSIATEAHLGGVGIMKKVTTIIDSYLENHTITGICISSAGMVDPEKGEIFFSGPTIPNYQGTQYKEVLENKYGVPVEIDNDVNCAGLAETVSGSAKGSEVTLCLTIGTGIGGCLLNGTEVFRGANNSACEVGYIPMGGSNFQECASTTTLVNKVSQAHGDATDEWNGYRIFEEAKAGNQICIDAIDEMVDYLGLGIATIAYVTNPKTVVLGGGVMGQTDYLRDRIQLAVQKYLLPHLAEELVITFAEHKNDAGMLGAFYHFMNQQKKKV